MSAQSGIWYFDSRPVSHNVIDALSHLNRDLGPDRAGIYTDAGIAMLSFCLHFDRLSQRERQPVCTSHAAVLTWDGRLDNRDDFIVRLCTGPADDTSDASLIAHAVDKWQDGALRTAIGDWSLVYWSTRARCLLLARDYAGNRPLYYHWCPQYCVWSTALEPIVDICETRGQINDCYMAGWLTFDPPPNQTCYRNIFSVPAGQAVRVQPGRSPNCRPFVHLEPDIIKYRTISQYEDQYRDLFTQAVKVRLRARKSVWTELSGGYDSSSVTCVASALVRGGCVEAPALQPVSIVTPDAPESDESRYIAAVESFCGLRSMKGPYRKHPEVDADSYGAPPLEGQQYLPSPQRLANEAGAHVLMTGMFGDVVTASITANQVFLEHILSGRLRTFVIECVKHCRVTKESFAGILRSLPETYLSSKRHTASTGLLDRAAMAALRPIAFGDIAATFGLREDFIHRALVPTAVNLDGLVERSGPSRRLLLGVRVFVGHDVVSAGRSSHALRITHPFMHRPLVEFVSAVPPTVLWSATHPRAFVLSGLRDILPDTIIKRGFKGDPTAAVSRDLSPIVARALPRLDRWLLVRHGYAEPSTLTELLMRFLSGSEPTALLVSRLLSGEALLQRLHRECRQSSDASSRRSDVAASHSSSSQAASSQNSRPARLC